MEPTGRDGNRKTSEREAREEAPYESQRRLREARRIPRLGDWTYEIETGETTWSPQVFELFERDPRLGAPDFQENLAYYTASSAARLQDRVRRAMELGEISDEIYELRLPSGRRAFHLGIIRVRRSADGRVSHLLGTVQDVTQATETRRLLGVTERIVHSSPVILFLWRNEPGWPLEYVSSNVVRILGYSVAELQRGDVVYRDLIHPDDRARVARRHEALGGSGPGPEGLAPYRLAARTGETIWVDDRTVPRHDPEGRTTHFEGIIVDITAQHEAELARATSEERYRQIVETTQDGIWIIDMEGRTRFANPQMARMLGCSLEELGRCAIQDFMDDEGRRQAERLLQRRREGIAEVHDFRFLRTDGSPLWVLVSTNPFTDQTGRVVGALGILTDITQRRLELETRQATQEMLRHAQKLESLSLLAGGVAHDFNNILMGVLGNAELALAELPEDAAVRPYLEGIRNSATRAADLSQQMLAYSGKGRFLIECVDLNQVLVGMRPIIDASVAKTAHVHFSLEEGLPAIDADVTQIRQVVLNLLINASEALEEAPGEISVRTRCRRVAEGELQDETTGRTLPPGEYVLLEVEDSGCGMDRETRERIFDPFFTTKFTGRGLGLAAVLGILQGHRGGVRVASQPGRGSTFSVSIPVSGGRTATPASAEPEPAAQRLSGRILLVDDERTVREVARRMLESLGLEVTTDADGVDALRTFEENPDRFDLVILDLTMPRMGGQETLGALRRIRPELPVLVASGYARDRILEGFEGAGPSGFLQKPFRIRQLRKALMEALPEAVRRV